MDRDGGEWPRLRNNYSLAYAFAFGAALRPGPPARRWAANPDWPSLEATTEPFVKGRRFHFDDAHVVQIWR